jgi:glycosyltransferase involved in cell wall biosynthesis
VKRPLVSIGMPVYNSRLDWFQEALDSLLAQDLTDFEIILSDNASDAASEAAYRAAAARDPRIRYVRHPRGMVPGHNFRFTAHEARGEFFFWAADDDVRGPSFLRRTLALLEANPRAVLANCQIAYIDEKGARAGAVPVHPATEESSVRGRVAALTSPGFYLDVYGLYRLSTFLRLGPFDWTTWGWDTVMVFKMLLAGPVLRIPDELFFFRVRAERGESLVTYLINQNAADDDERFDWEAKRSRELLGALWRSNLNLADKLSCLPRVTAILRRSPFTDERSTLMRYRFNRAVAERDYSAAFAAAARFAVLSPEALLRPSAWRLAYEQWTRRP